MSDNLPGHDGFGKEPEPPEGIYTAAQFLKAKGVPLDVRRKWASAYGREVKRRYISRRLITPRTVGERHRGALREVCVYTHADLEILTAVWADFSRRIS